MSEHDELTVDQALELLRQHHADGDDFGTDAAITIRRAQNLIDELRNETGRLDALWKSEAYLHRKYYDRWAEACQDRDETERMLTFACKEWGDDIVRIRREAAE